jgi:hypothetical protein
MRISLNLRILSEPSYKLEDFFAILRFYLLFLSFICDSWNLLAIPKFYLRFSEFICDPQILFAILRIYLRSSNFICDSQNYLRNSKFICDPFLDPIQIPQSSLIILHKTEGKHKKASTTEALLSF